MKLKYPKKIRIGSTYYKVTYQKDKDEGAFHYGERWIHIGTNSKDVLRILEIIIHELKEIIQMEQMVRHNQNSVAGAYIFNYDHDRHTDLCARLAGLLDDFIK